MAAPIGCDGCPGSKPYTPYTLSDSASATAPQPPVDAGAPLPSASATAAQVDAGTPAFAVVNGAQPPGDGKSWPLDGGVSVNAPIGRTFGVGLAIDVDGDGTRDLLAWAHAPDGLRGELWFASGKSPDAGRTVAALPADLSAPGCTATAELAQVGPRTVAFDFAPRCDGGAREKAIRWVAVLRLPSAGGAPEIILELRAGAPAQGESIQLAIDARDRDADARDDVAVKVTLSGAPAPFAAANAAASATLAYFDRPAGLSRDPSEPEASLKAFAASLIADARKRTSAPRVGPSAVALRRLHALLCDEPAKAKISVSAGPVRCGEPRYLEDAAVAEIEAALNLGDPIDAFAGLAHLEALGASRKDADALLAKHVPAAAATALHRTTAAPRGEPAPSYGPLAFDAAGDLLLRAEGRVVRVDHADFAESPLDPAPAWPARLAWPAETPAWKLVDVEQRCDRPTLVARFESTGAAGEAGTVERALPILTAPRCAPAAHLAADLLGPSAQGALLAIGPELVAIPTEGAPKPTPAEAITPGGAIPPGAMRSPDGGTVAVHTSRGILVATAKPKGGMSARLWTGIDAGAFCAPSNAGARLACVTDGAATIYEAK